MKFAIIALIIATSYAFQMTDLSRNTQKHVEELQKSRWGRTLLELVELHGQAGGVIDELVQGIEELISDLNEELQELDFDFGARTNQHNSLVVQLTQDIQDAELDIQRTDDTLENLLKPRRAQIKAKIQNLQDNQVANRKKLNEVNLVRTQQRQEFEATVAEYNSAIGAVDEALALLDSISNPSLLQIKQINHSLQRVEARIRPHTEQSTLIKALIALASEQNFSNQDTLRTIIVKLNEFRVAVVNAINDATATDAVNQTDYEERVDQLNAEYAGFQRQINQNTIDYDAIVDKINQLTEFVSQRNSDRKAFEAQLQLENDCYAEETEIYTSLKNEYLRELAIAEQALGMVQGIDFSRIKI